VRIEFLTPGGALLAGSATRRATLDKKSVRDMRKSSASRVELSWNNDRYRKKKRYFGTTTVTHPSSIEIEALGSDLTLSQTEPHNTIFDLLS
jgi:hypothetical protein